jgi:phosphohistidine swiveling domain-containing protein
MGVCGFAGFSVTGASYTEYARQSMAEGDWKEGVDYLMSCLLGMTEEQAISIIEGERKLVGQGSQVTMVAEDPEVTKELKESYLSDSGLGGFVQRDGRMYKAYRVIDNLGPEDADKLHVNHEVVSGARLLPEWLHAHASIDRKMCNHYIFPERLLEVRALFYADDRDRDFASIVLSREGKWVALLFEEVTEGENPPWREKQHTSTQSAYNQLAEFLPVDGYAQTYGVSAPDSNILKPREAIDKELAAEERAEQDAKLREELAQSKVREAEREAEIAKAREAVCQFADNDAEYGWYTYKWKSTLPGVTGITVRAPKRALYCYALSTTPAYHLAPAYAAFSPQGLKLYEDNPLHTDVWLGCGYDIDTQTYDRGNPFYHAVIDMMGDVQKELLKFEVQVLARGPELTGKVVYPDSPKITKDDILVVPHAGVEFELQALKAGAIICEVGGRLAHLVTVCREMQKSIIRMDDALAKLKPGQEVTVYPDSGKVKISPDRQRIV